MVSVAVLLVLVLSASGYGTLSLDSSKLDPIEFSTCNAGSTTTCTLYLVNDSKIPTGDYLKIVLPPEFPAQTFAIGATCSVSGKAHPCSVENVRTVSIKAASDIRSGRRLVVVIPGLVTPTTAGGTGYFQAFSMRDKGGQLIDKNDALGTMGFAPPFASATATISVAPQSTFKTGASATYIFRLTLKTALPQFSSFRVTLPKDFIVANPLTCASVAGTTTPAVSGTFTCTVDSSENAIYVVGLAQSLAIGAEVGLSFGPVKNPGAVMAPGATTIYIDSLRTGSKVVIDRASVSSPEIVANAITATLTAYSSTGRFTQNNVLLTSLVITLTNPVPKGGRIDITYGANVAIAAGEACVVTKGLSSQSAGSYPVCTATNGSPNVSLTSFADLPAAASVTVVVRLSLGTANLSFVQMRSYNLAGALIDSDAGTQAAVTLLTKPSFDQTSSTLTYLKKANEKGGVGIDLKLTIALPASSLITVSLPTGFTTSETIACTQAVDSGVAAAASCLLSGSKIAITLSSTLLNSGQILKLTMSSTSGLSYPALGSVPSVPQEWCIDAKAPSTTDFDASSCLRTILSPATFQTFTVQPLSSAAGGMTPVVLTLKVDVPLPNELGTAKIVFDFNTRNDADSANAFDLDLGTGLASGSSVYFIPSQSLVASTSLSLTLTKAASASTTNKAQLVLKGFKSLGASTTISIEAVLKIPSSSQTDNSITATASYTDALGFVVTTQIKTVSLASTTAAADFTVKTLTPRTMKEVSQSTQITGQLQMSGAADSPAQALLLLLFPADWDLTSTAKVMLGTTALTVTKVYNNTYAPTLLAQLGTNKISFSTPTAFSVTGLTNPFCETLGAGAIVAGVIDSTTFMFINYGALAPSLEGATSGKMNFNVTSTSLSRLGWDVTYTFAITTNNSYPAGSSVRVTFPSGFDLTKAYCDFSMNIRDLSTTVLAQCDVSSLYATLSNFATIAAKTAFSINVRVVKNPDVVITPPFQVQVFGRGVQLIEQQQTGPTLNMTALAVPVNASAPLINFFPSTAGAQADFSMAFTLQTAVPNGGRLQIVFPSQYAFPTLTPSNCILNYQYSTCMLSGSTISIEPILRYSAGSRLQLEIPRMIVPSVSVSSALVKISVTWLGLTICTTPDSFNFTFTPTAARQSALLTALSVFPLNAAERARYEFSFTADSPIYRNMSLLLWFPLEFPGSLGDLTCSSTAASNNDTKAVLCSNPATRGYLVITGFADIPSKTIFNLTIQGLLNPGVAGSVSSISAATLNPNNSYVDVRTNSQQLSFTAVPGYMTMRSISLSDWNIKALANYTFSFSPSGTVTAGTEAWVRFPEEFTNQLLGFGEFFNCSGALATGTSWGSAQQCVNRYENLITAVGGSAAASETISLTINNVKSPSIPGSTHTLMIELYDPVTKSISYRNYGPENGNDTITFSTQKHQVIVGLDNQIIVLTPGISQSLTLHMDSEKLPSRQALSFVPTIIGPNNSTGIAISPNPVTMNVGDFSVSFTVSASPLARQGDYLIKWTLLGDAIRLYTGVANTVLRVDASQLFTVNVPTVPTLFKGKTSIPLKLTLDIVPLVAFDVSFECSVKTVTPTVATFSAGSPVATFTIFVTNTTEERSATMTVTLHASCCFRLSRSILYLVMTDYDETPPEIAAFVIANPRGHLFTDITLQTTEACSFIYIHGERGLPKPSNDTLALNMPDAFVVPIGNDFRYDFRISGQLAETDYVLYGILKDLNDNYMLDVFAIPYSTADLYESVSFTLTFVSAPPAGAIEQFVVPALVKQLALPKAQQLVVAASQGRRLQQNTATFTIMSDSSFPPPSPADRVRYMAVTAELNALLAGSGVALDPAVVISNSLKIVPNPRPEWILMPNVTLVTKESVNVSFSSTVSGTVYAEVIPDIEMAPSGRQIALGLNAYNETSSLITSKPIAANQTTWLVVEKLTPTTSYVLVITVKNSDTRQPRYMEEDLMAKMNIITQAGQIPSNHTDSSALLLGFGVALLLT